MANRIFVLNNNNELIGMEERQYDTEDLLQSLLANYPALLASDEIGSVPRQWLLISRETPVPDMEEASGRWSLDHLFLDQDAIPTLVEVKRSTDTRIRREVVGQMLDYAANAVVYWKVDEIRTRFEAYCEQNNINTSQMIADQLGITDTEAFWNDVRTNLLAGKIRLIFVADVIPYELKRIIEFLNKQMNPAEVLGIEIKHFVGQGLKTFVPTVIGQTAEARQTKNSSRSSYQWDEQSFFSVFEEQHGQKTAHTAYKILEWAKSRSLRIWWGTGKQSGSFFPIFDYGGENYTFIALWTGGGVETQFQHMREPFKSPDKKREFMLRLNQIPGVSIPENSLTRRPTFPLKVLNDSQNMNHFLQTLDWLLAEIKSYHD